MSLFIELQDADVRSEKVVMEDRLTLKASAPWISMPSALMLASNGRSFEIEVWYLSVHRLSMYAFRRWISVS